MGQTFALKQRMMRAQCEADTVALTMHLWYALVDFAKVRWWLWKAAQHKRVLAPSSATASIHGPTR